MIDEHHIDALTKLLGDKGIVTRPEDMEAYETGARYDRGRAAAVLRPATTAEASAAVSYCVRNGIALIPQAGNTGLVSGSTPDGSGSEAVLSLDRLTRRFELDLDNRSVRVDAGFRLSDLNRKLEEHDLFFPIDLGADPRLGGMIATNTGGSRFLKYGDVRRNTLGLKVVLADAAGTVLDLDCDLRKNNTGVDWKQIFIGTSGVFGIVTECVLNLERLPKQVATAFLVPASGAQVLPLLNAMEERLGAYLSAFEGMSKNAIAAAFAHVPSLKNPFQGGNIPDYVILAEIARTWAPREEEQPLDAVLETVLAEIWELQEALLADAFVGPPHETWALRHALSEGVKHLGKLVAFDLSFRRGDIMAFCDHMKAEMPETFPGVTVCDFGHIGDGGVHFNLVVAKDSPLLTDPSFEQRLREWVFTVAVEQYRGSFSAEHAIGRRNQAYYDFYTPEKLKEMAAGLKTFTSPGKLGSVRFG
ncbi:FAD-dependent oxidoreductase [Sinorhizobium fredii USDA 205]|uniref:FAD-binding protein n=2 Tax=Rhizobium fredii TaxID=380 RepID=A0A844AJG8_RHIFR|nr:FAD-binding oxidoreductase [Sinorhizobium fredii]ASY70891.1 putative OXIDOREDUCTASE protein [Sinorhizobium fredii CCBAU 83666]AWM26952.1 PUTATIVE OXIDOREDUCTASE PROTEIN [Sinorhizobium fredii CCBAU 25509]KSV83115.1 FAD-dependent oxidoreductase [Sinorhizobium fredii USDA 205]MQW94463.1 FAD-binding protein [Sinorhizobium fredii]MQX11500.1 FAD-binding protein [Sinorhizobium fredii]